jgi:hypothetical protein
VEKGLKGMEVAGVILPMGVAVKQEVYRHKIVVSMDMMMDILWTAVMLVEAHCYD